MDEDNRLALERGRGAQARAVLESKIYQEAIEAVENNIVERWKTAPIADEQGMMALRLKWQCMQEIKGYLTNVMQTGVLADQTITEKRSMAERARRAVANFRR